MVDHARALLALISGPQGPGREQSNDHGTIGLGLKADLHLPNFGQHSLEMGLGQGRLAKSPENRNAAVQGML